VRPEAKKLASGRTSSFYFNMKMTMSQPEGLVLIADLMLEKLAEGVETAGEHALMAQLGADHVQGFVIGKPMPFGKAQDWISAHQAKLKGAPEIGRKTG